LECPFRIGGLVGCLPRCAASTDVPLPTSPNKNRIPRRRRDWISPALETKIESKTLTKSIPHKNPGDTSCRFRIRDPPKTRTKSQDHRKRPCDTKSGPISTGLTEKTRTRSRALRKMPGALSPNRVNPGWAPLAWSFSNAQSNARESDEPRSNAKMTEAEVLKRPHSRLFHDSIKKRTAALKSRDWNQLAAIYSRLHAFGSFSSGRFSVVFSRRKVFSKRTLRIRRTWHSDGDRDRICEKFSQSTARTTKTPILNGCKP